MEFLEGIFAQYPIINQVLVILGSLLVLAQVVVLLTPSKKDDAKLEELKKNSIFKKIWDFLLSFSVLQKKEGKIKLSKDE